MATQRDLTFRQMVDLSFGFLGVQIAYALQSANISRIFATLGADPHQLSFFWILPPLTSSPSSASGPTVRGPGWAGASRTSSSAPSSPSW